MLNTSPQFGVATYLSPLPLLSLSTACFNDHMLWNEQNASASLVWVVVGFLLEALDTSLRIFWICLCLRWWNKLAVLLSFVGTICLQTLHAVNCFLKSNQFQIMELEPHLGTSSSLLRLPPRLSVLLGCECVVHIYSTSCFSWDDIFLPWGMFWTMYRIAHF